MPVESARGRLMEGALGAVSAEVEDEEEHVGIMATEEELDDLR